MKLRPVPLALPILLAAATADAQHQMEYLDRGLVAMRLDPDRVLLSWRLLGSDPAATSFHVYRGAPGAAPERITAVPLIGPTRFTDDTADLTRDQVYFVRPVHNGVGQDISEPAPLAADSPVFDHLTLALDKPADVTDPIVGSYSYSANDCSVADLDGDGRLEIVLKWDPSNSKDNSQSGHTGNVLLDAYELDGGKLWRIDLGRNIRAGAHYTQFIVYDFDGDGKAEVACRTAPGATDGQGDDVADAAKWQNAGGPDRPVFLPTDDYRNGSGYILAGPEFLTIFEGTTGDELVSTSFIPFRDPDNDEHSPAISRINQVWGDGYGNRIDRFLAGAAYLDGVQPSLVMTRGYYTRTYLVAWDWREDVLTRRWVFDSTAAGNTDYASQGAHSLTVGDVDNDTRDEIVFGGCTIDDDGTGLYSTQLGVGDALHLSDMDPNRPGQEVWMVHESPSSYGDHASEVHDAATGEILFSVPASDDVGRGVAADIDPRYAGFEVWSSRASLHNVTGTQIITSRPGPMNFFCWWDGDLLRELLDGTTISKWNWNTNSNPALLAPAGVSSNNGTKATPCLSADLFGDWREEVVWRESDSTALRIYSTTIATSYRLPTLLHDRQYRLAIAWQNVGYNQPPHPGYFLGDGMTTVPLPSFTTVAPPGTPPPVDERFPAWLASRGLDPGLDPELDHDGNGLTLFAEYAFDATHQPPLRVLATGPEAVLDLAAVRSELDYRIDCSGDLAGWLPLVVIGGTGGGRQQVTVPIDGNEGAEFFRAVAVPNHQSSSLTYQAEDAAFNGSFANNHSGYNGTGFINSDPSGSFIEFSGVDGGAGGFAQLTFRHALGVATSRTGQLVVNGASQPITFEPTGAWNSWAELRITVALNAGATNTIRLETTGDDLANIDELTVTTGT